MRVLARRVPPAREIEHGVAVRQREAQSQHVKSLVCRQLSRHAEAPRKRCRVSRMLLTTRCGVASRCLIAQRRPPLHDRVVRDEIAGTRRARAVERDALAWLS